MKELSKLDREYREKLRKKNIGYLAAIIFMLICSAILFIGTKWYELKINDHAVGFLSGFFFSLCSVFVIFLFKNRQTMKNPEKLRQERIVKTDERNIEISAKSLQITTFVMVISLAILSIVGSFISRTLMTTASGLLNLFLISYIVSYFFYKKKL